MREVVILGVGLHKFGRFPEKRVEDIGREAILNALADSGVPFKDIEAAYCGHVYQPMGAGLRVVGEVGQTGIPIINVEVACASSSTAFRLAYQAIASGIYDICLAVGFEKMQRGMLPGTLEAGSYEELMGYGVLPGLYALQARRHIHDYGSTVEQFAQVSVKNHRNGCLNPNAQYQEACTLEQVLGSRMIADPITLLQCSPTSDGASAAVLCAREVAASYGGKPMKVAGWAAGSPHYTKGGIGGDLAEGMVERLSKQAYEMAGVGPEDIKVVQVHDAFTPGEILTIEQLGFCPEGEGGRWTMDGRTEIGGKIPVNTDGGLLSRGHPIGATGLAQIAEIVRQLRGEAGPRQVPNNPKVGLCHNVGIGGCTITILVK